MFNVAFGNDTVFETQETKESLVFELLRVLSDVKNANTYDYQQVQIGDKFLCLLTDDKDYDEDGLLTGSKFRVLPDDAGSDDLTEEIINNRNQMLENADIDKGDILVGVIKIYGNLEDMEYENIKVELEFVEIGHVDTIDKFIQQIISELNSTFFTTFAKRLQDRITEEFKSEEENVLVEV